MSDYRLDDFKSYFGQFSQRLEQHRRRCLHIFILSSGAAVVLVLLLPWYANGLAEGLHRFFRAIASSGGRRWPEHASPADVAAVAFFVVGIGAWLIFGPVFAYRGSNRSAGMIA